jgi:hypothetical protein
MPHVVILPHVIEKKLKVEERQEVLTFINDIISDTASELKNDIIEIVEEKFERRLITEIANLKTEMIERFAGTDAKIADNKASLETKLADNIASLETKLADNIASLETKLAENKASLEAKMADNKAEMIKWMCIFWIGNVITVIGGIVGILKLAKVF